MPVNLLRLFVNTGTVKLFGLPLRSAFQKRLIATMDIATTEVKPDEIKPDDEIIQNKDHTRYRKRQRNWDDYHEHLTEQEIKEKRLCNENGEKIKRRKMAMLLGYCGVDYFGMQRNPGVRTIEEDLLKALLEAHYITPDDFQNQQNAQFQRSSRTDKGVSAARQVVSLKIPLETQVEEINKRLPECIRVFGVKRVTNKFNSKVKCSARTYSYTLPTYILDANVVTEEDRMSFRIPQEKLEEINRILGLYKGTKNYHNFTEKKFYQDPSSCRYMYSFTVDKVFVESGMEFAVLLVKGQSFMLHQIRKMVGLAVAIMRGHTDQATFDKAFTRDKVMLPTAPGLGLVLDMVHYDRYDARYKLSHETLTWEDCEEMVQDFKHKYIYPNIVKGEVEGNSMFLWLDKLYKHHYEPLDNPEQKSDENVDGESGEKGDDDDDDDCEAMEMTAKENNEETNDGNKINVTENLNKIETKNNDNCEHTIIEVGENNESNGKMGDDKKINSSENTSEEETISKCSNVST